MFDIKLVREGDSLVSIRSQPGREAMLETIKQQRLEGGARDAPGLGRLALQIPFEDWLRVRAMFPDLASTDPIIKSRAYARFIASPESEPFRVRDRI